MMEIVQRLLVTYMVYVVMVCYRQCVYCFPLVCQSLRHLRGKNNNW